MPRRSSRARRARGGSSPWPGLRARLARLVRSARLARPDLVGRERRLPDLLALPALPVPQALLALRVRLVLRAGAEPRWRAFTS